MYEIPLQKKERQTIGFRLGMDTWKITLREVQHMMIADLYRNDLLLCLGIRCIVGKPLIPYGYLVEDGKTFFFANDTESADEYPDWREFGEKVFLRYGELK